MVRVVEQAGVRLADLAGIVVGTGPGAFTGLRVGIATAKTLAHELSLPIVGIPTSDALLAGHGAPALLWLPSGPRDRVAVVAGGEPVVVAGADPGPIAAAGLRRGRRRPRRARARGCARARGRAVVAALPRVAAPPGRRAARAPATRTTRSGSSRATRASRAARRRATRKGAWRGRATPGSPPDRADDVRGPAGRPRHRARVASPCRGRTTPIAASSTTNRLASYVVARADDAVVGFGGLWVMVDEAHVTTFAVDPALAPARGRGAPAARRCSTSRSRAGRARRRSRSGCRTCRRGACTRSTASGPSASGRATTPTTARTR